MRRSPTLWTAAVCALLLSGCSSMSLQVRHTSDGKDASVRSTEQAVKHSKKHGPLKVPPGHLPAPGHCRVWFPGTPPGKQPPQGDCATLSRHVPAGAWLLHRSVEDPRHVEVSVYEEHRPGVLIEVRVFEAATGTFVRVQAEASL